MPADNRAKPVSNCYTIVYRSVSFTHQSTYIQKLSRFNTAKVIRSGTGCENAKSIRLHEKLGYYQYRYEFEKVL